MVTSLPPIASASPCSRRTNARQRHPLRARRALAGAVATRTRTFTS